MDNKMIMHDPPHPGYLLKRVCLDPLGLSIAEAARQLGMTRQGLSYVVRGECGISAKLAIGLEGLGWSSAEMWLAMQASYNLWQAGYRGPTGTHEQRTEWWRQRMSEAAKLAPGLEGLGWLDVGAASEPDTVSNISTRHLPCWETWDGD